MADIPAEFVIDERPQPISPPAVSDLRNQIVALIKRRTELAEQLEEVGRRQKRQKRRLFLDLLEVMDGFDRIFRDIDLARLDERTRNLVDSFNVTSIVLENVLDQEEVMPMETPEGSPFDPHLQEIIQVERRARGPDGLVLEVRDRGYWWHDQVLRKARVIVSKKS